MSPTPGKPHRLPFVVRGSLITVKRKCGNPNCRCARGALHTNPALAYSVGGKMHLLYLRPQDVPHVEAARARYQRAQAALEQRALRGIATLRGRLAREKAAAKARRR
jgi:hypothetical protein